MPSDIVDDIGNSIGLNASDMIIQIKRKILHLLNSNERLNYIADYLKLAVKFYVFVQGNKLVIYDNAVDNSEEENKLSPSRMLTSINRVS